VEKLWSFWARIRSRGAINEGCRGGLTGSRCWRTAFCSTKRESHVVPSRWSRKADPPIVEKMRIRRPSALLLIRVIVQIAMTKIPLFLSIPVIYAKNGLRDS
jgi:hypothetical protein